MSNAEELRLEQARKREMPWKSWGPYLSERQWGTVREDYSEDGNAWDYFTHDQSRSRAYKWGEDGIAGICDEHQRLCWALALWNGKDPILKERLFGLANSEGNHGEDVKEYYFYLDSTPTHSYMKYLYKYPQAAYPYEDLVKTNRARARTEPEYELLDTGAFAENRYFDVFIETAKAAPEEILLRVVVENRGPEAADLHLLPHLWFRNTWWRETPDQMPVLRALPARDGLQVIEASLPEMGSWYMAVEGEATLLFTNNETNNALLFAGENGTAYVKDAFHRCVVNGEQGAVNPEQMGTKSAAHVKLSVPAGGSVTLRLRLGVEEPTAAHFGATYDAVFAERIADAYAFYAQLTPERATPDEALVYRQALSGMLWTKQYYYFDLDYWLHEHDSNPLSGGSRTTRNRDWFHMANEHIISMPDKWEYPWYAAWDLAFHTLALQLVDPDFAKGQLRLMLEDTYLHPNGQIPAYEWNFGDVNPPVHAFATLFNYVNGRADGSRDEDVRFVKYAFSRLVLNFSWWVNRKDPRGRNAFNGGFLGLDNIGVFDRSSPLPTGGFLEQADGTAWMALFSQNMLELALTLAEDDPDFEGMVSKFMQHFLWIAGSMDRAGDQRDEMWDERDGFFYDVLILPDGRAERMRVRSMVGLLPLTATTIISAESLERFPGIAADTAKFIRRHPELLAGMHPINVPGYAGRRLVSVLDEGKLRRILARMLDENGFLSAYGIRALSREHLDQPFVINVGGQEYKVQYLPGESDNGMFGGNSNWRGPIWFPVNVLIIRALLQYYRYFGDALKVELPTGSGQEKNLYEVAEEIANRLIGIFTLNEEGRRAVFGGAEVFRNDPHWRDNILFYEYFHGDDGSGIGAGHQTGWTGTVARLLHFFRSHTAESFLNQGLHKGESETATAL